jgi:hypothetical protein
MQHDASTLARFWLAFQEGGWMMWFIFLFGLLALSAAGRFALRGEHQLLGFVKWMCATAFGSGVFGFLIGMSKVFQYVVHGAKPGERALILVEGTREALQNVNAASLFVLIVCLLVAIGQRRYPLPNPSAVPR